MDKKYLELGKIVSTHGVRGEMRVNPWCQDFSVLKQVKKVYTKSDGSEFLNVTGIRPHGNIVLLKTDEVSSLEQAEALRGTVLYLDKHSVTLKPDEYFVQDIIGCDVFDDASGEKVGTVSDVSETGANDVWHITTVSGSEVLIPKIPQVVKSVDVTAQTVRIVKMKGLFDDED